MSVYTSVSDDELRGFLSNFDVGAYLSHSGISDGIENTNYRVETERGRFVLTLFERTPASDLVFCLDLMSYLAKHGLACARPLATNKLNVLHELKRKPAVLVEHLNGSSVLQPNTQQCAALGTVLSEMHALTTNYPKQRANDRGMHWQQQTLATIRSKISSQELALANDVSAQLNQLWDATLPSGVVHADLFRDNALFVGDALSGVIDFYYAHSNCFVYDVAIAVSDWCFDPLTGFDEASCKALLDAYQRTRPFTSKERAYWTLALQAAAFRFWLSRRHDELFPRAGETTFTKDPAHFKQLLERVVRADAPPIPGSS